MSFFVVSLILHGMVWLGVDWLGATRVQLLFFRFRGLEYVHG